MSYLLAILSGVLTALTYPTRFGSVSFPDLGWMAFFCYVPLFIAFARKSPGAIFRLTFVSGLFHFGISQYWLYTAIHEFGGLSPTLTVLVLGLLILILSAYVGLIPSLAAWLATRLKISFYFLLPVIWVVVEYVRQIFPLGGYPWGQLAYTQGGFLAFVQSAEIWGAYGINFLMVLANGTLSVFILQSFFKGRESWFTPSKLSFSLGVVLLVLNVSFGFWRLASPLPTPIQEISTGIIQGNIPQEEKWQRGRARHILDIFLTATKRLEAQGAQLILWPEASMPISLAFDAKRLPLSLKTHEADVLLGTIGFSRQEVLRRQASGERGRGPVYNTALLVSADGDVLDHYHKKKLVPFGEYVPLKELLFFAKKLTAEVGDLRAGEIYRPIDYKNDKLGVLICYEDIFPFIARSMVAQGANALVNLTNDAWYGFSSAPYQHQVYSQMRSIETRRALVRATNTGVSSLINPKGEIQWQGGLYTREDFLTPLALYTGKSFFVKAGYLLPHVLGALSLVLIVLAWRRPSLNKRA